MLVSARKRMQPGHSQLRSQFVFGNNTHGITYSKYPHTQPERLSTCHGLHAPRERKPCTDSHVNTTTNMYRLIHEESSNWTGSAANTSSTMECPGISTCQCTTSHALSPNRLGRGHLFSPSIVCPCRVKQFRNEHDFCVYQICTGIGLQT